MTARDARDHGHRDRTAGFNGDAPEHQPADACDYVAHMVGFAGRDAARGQHQVVLGGRRGKRAFKFFRIVAQNAEIGDFDVKARHQSRQQIAVGIVQRGARQSGARLDDFVAGREQRDAHPAVHSKLGETERGGERHVLHGKPPAGRHGNRPCPQVLAGKPPIGAALQAWRHDDAAAVDAAILLHENGIGACRHRRAGKDADRLAGVHAHASRHDRRRPDRRW